MGRSRFPTVDAATDPFCGRDSISSDEYREWLAAGGPTAFVAPMPEAPPDWQTSEKAFMAKVVGFATEHGWLSYHTWKSANSAPGFPDLVLLRRDRLIFAELKVGKRRPTKAQCAWIDWLSLVSWEAKQCGFDKIGVYVWTPDDMAKIVEILS